MSGIDANCILVLKGDDVDGSINFVDSSPSQRVLSRVGTVEIDDAQSQFGGSSIKFVNGYLQTADGADLALGNSDFTFELFPTPDEVATSKYFMMQSDGSKVVYLLWYNPGGGAQPFFSFQIYQPGLPALVFNAPYTLVLNQRFHYQLKRENNVFTMKVNGALIGSAQTFSQPWPDVAAPLTLAAKSDGTGKFTGWWDELRFSKVARADSIPPSAAYTAPPPPVPPASGVSEQAFFSDKCAMLEPDAYEYKAGPFFDVVENEPVLLVNAWQATWNGNNKFYYHRKADVENAVMLPAGTRIQHTGSPPNYHFEYGYAMYCKPSKVNSDPRYANARDLWYDRQEVLKKLTLHSLDVEIAQGHTVAQAIAANTLVKQFPTNFENGLIVQFSMMDGCWIVIEDPAPPSGIQTILNLSDELDDVRSQRLSGKLLMPFKRSQFPQLRVGFGSVFAIKNGTPANVITPVNADTATYPEYGSIKYYKLDELAALGLEW